MPLGVLNMHLLKPWFGMGDIRQGSYVSMHRAEDA